MKRSYVTRLGFAAEMGNFVTTDPFSTIFLLFLLVASCLEYEFLISFSVLLHAVISRSLLHPGTVTASRSCSFVCAVPGAVICQLSGGV